MPAPASQRRPHRSGPSGFTSGFTMVELLVTAGLLSVVVASIGSAILSEVNSSSRLQSGIDQLDGLSRVRQLMQQEVARADRLSTNSADVPSGCSITNPLVLFGFGDTWRIAYGIRAQGPNASWQGPGQLLRCGPPYTSAGLSENGAIVQSVLVDRLPISNGFTASLSGTGTGTFLDRDAAISLRLQDGSGGADLTTSFRLNIATNRTFSICSGTGCSTTASTDFNYWRPSGGTVTGSTTKTDVVFFTATRAGYNLSNPCRRSSCTISVNTAVNPSSNTPVTVTNGDVLVFSDQDLYLTP